MSQLSGFMADFSGDGDAVCDGLFGQEGRILRRILWRIFCLVFFLKIKTALGRGKLFYLQLELFCLQLSFFA